MKNNEFRESIFQLSSDPELSWEEFARHWEFLNVLIVDTITKQRKTVSCLSECSEKEAAGLKMLWQLHIEGGLLLFQSMPWDNLVISFIDTRDYPQKSHKYFEENNIQADEEVKIYVGKDNVIYKKYGSRTFCYINGEFFCKTSVNPSCATEVESGEIIEFYKKFGA
jgi:hypothetical protein